MRCGERYPRYIWGIGNIRFNVLRSRLVEHGRILLITTTKKVRVFRWAL